MLIAVFSGFALAFFAPLLHRLLHRYTGWVLALLPLSLFLFFAIQLPTIAHGETITAAYSWVPTLSVNLYFLLDGLSLMMALIITGIGTLIFIYAAGYLHGDPLEGRFYSYLLIFMAAMVGLVLSNNLLTLFIFWELTSISSYLLIGYKHNYADSRAAALRALLVTGTGGLAMLAGFILLGMVTGTMEISALAEQSSKIHQSDLYLPLLILIGLGAFTKSAQFPFHFWLPGAMAAPTPVSAYLHSATMVKAGVYLLARLSPALSGTSEWRLLLVGVGVVTMLIGGYLSLKQVDLKRILAYSTVSSLGLLVALLGWDTKIAAEAAMLFLLVHSLYKGALFMIAGAIDHETGTRDINRLGGLLRVMPMIAFGTVLAALSMAGIPPLLGFIGKELVYEASLGYEGTLELGVGHVFFTITAVLGNLSFVAVAFLMFFKPFTGNQGSTPSHPHRAPLSLWLGPVALGVIALALALVTQLPITDVTSEYLIGPAAGAVYGSEVELHLHLIPSAVSPMLILSIITIAGGIAAFYYWTRLRAPLEYVDFGAVYGPEQFFNRLVDGLPGFSKSVTHIFQNGYLRYYVATIVGTLVILVGFTFFNRVALPVLGPIDVRFYELVLAAIILVALALIVTSSHLLYTVVSLGVIGYAIALIFILYGAPDLAMTQFSIETLSVVLFVLVLYRLPDMAHLSARRARIRDAIISISAGGLVTVLILTITNRPLLSKLSDFFVANSYTEAKGHNIVNVILVDFRGFDTLGEITVLSIAAIGVYALLKLRIQDSADDDTEKYEDMVSVEMHEEVGKEQDH
ncbi:MAG: putative monovalent cation/H+ antiporter subunit A [Anaerolineae bacterium]|nr:putative monovalent cation/H+ antiporter subunit A [Anaerolineae bacterium]